MFWVALAAYLSFYPAMLLPALLLFTKQVSLDEPGVYVCVCVLKLCVHVESSGCWILCKLDDYLVWYIKIVCRILGFYRIHLWYHVSIFIGNQSKHMMGSIFLTDLTPNVGVFWYFFIELFDQFRSFFMLVFQFHAFIFTLPVCIKFR